MQTNPVKFPKEDNYNPRILNFENSEISKRFFLEKRIKVDEIVLYQFCQKDKINIGDINSFNCNIFCKKTKDYFKCVMTDFIPDILSQENFNSFSEINTFNVYYRTIPYSKPLIVKENGNLYLVYTRNGYICKWSLKKNENLKCNYFTKLRNKPLKLFNSFDGYYWGLGFSNSKKLICKIRKDLDKLSCKKNKTKFLIREFYPIDSNSFAFLGTIDNNLGNLAKFNFSKNKLKISNLFFSKPSLKYCNSTNCKYIFRNDISFVYISPKNFKQIRYSEGNIFFSSFLRFQLFNKFTYNKKDNIWIGSALYKCSKSGIVWELVDELLKYAEVLNLSQNVQEYLSLIKEMKEPIQLYLEEDKNLKDIILASFFDLRKLSNLINSKKYKNSHLNIFYYFPLLSLKASNYLDSNKCYSKYFLKVLKINLNTDIVKEMDIPIIYQRNLLKLYYYPIVIANKAFIIIAVYDNLLKTYQNLLFSWKLFLIREDGAIINFKNTEFKLNLRSERKLYLCILENRCEGIDTKIPINVELIENKNIYLLKIKYSDGTEEFWDLYFRKVTIKPSN